MEPCAARRIIRQTPKSRPQAGLFLQMNLQTATRPVMARFSAPAASCRPTLTVRVLLPQLAVLPQPGAAKPHSSYKTFHFLLSAFRSLCKNAFFPDLLPYFLPPHSIFIAYLLKQADHAFFWIFYKYSDPIIPASPRSCRRILYLPDTRFHSSGIFSKAADPALAGLPVPGPGCRSFRRILRRPPEARRNWDRFFPSEQKPVFRCQRLRPRPRSRPPPELSLTVPCWPAGYNKR